MSNFVAGCLILVAVLLIVGVPAAIRERRRAQKANAKTNFTIHDLEGLTAPMPLDVDVLSDGDRIVLGIDNGTTLARWTPREALAVAQFLYLAALEVINERPNEDRILRRHGPNDRGAF